jgi:hypothetical protein
MFLVFYTFIRPYTLVVTYMYFSVLYSVHVRMAHVGRNMWWYENVIICKRIFGCYRGKVFVFYFWYIVTGCTHQLLRKGNHIRLLSKELTFLTPNQRCPSLGGMGNNISYEINCIVTWNMTLTLLDYDSTHQRLWLCRMWILLAVSATVQLKCTGFWKVRNF